MNSLPPTSLATRLNAIAAAATVTLVLLSGIDAMAQSDRAAPMLARVAVAQPA